MTYPAKCTLYNNNTQLTFICSKSTIQTIKKMWNIFKVNNKNTRATTMNDVVLMFSLKTYFIPFSIVSIVVFKQVSVSWVMFAKFFFTLWILEKYRPGIAFWLLLTENLCLEKHLWIVCDYKFLPIDCMIFLGVDKCTMS